MDAAFSWIGQLAEFCAQFVPRVFTIESTAGGVKFVTFRWRDCTFKRWPQREQCRIEKLDPGLHFYWPVVTKLALYPTARQGADLKSQTITTKDEKSILVGGLIVYEIKDIEAILGHTYDPEQTIKDIALSAIHRVLSARTWAEIRETHESGSLDKALKAEVQSELNKYGVRVLKTMLTDLAPCRVYRVIQSTSSDAV